MKKTIIASKNLVNLGMQQVITTLNTSECTIERKTFYNGKISRKETDYFEDNYVLDISWDNETKYFQKNDYTIIMI